MINRLADRITKRPKIVILVALLLLIPSFLGMIFTPVNYDILSYLPEELDSVKGINILDDEFHEASMAIVVMDGLSWNEMYELEDKFKEIDAVNTVLWIGAMSESPIPLSMLPDGVTSMLFNDDSTLMIVQFKTSAGDNATLKAIESMKEITNRQCLISGMSAMTQDMKQMLESEILIYVAVAVSLVLVALALTMESFVSPIILLVALGISILYNMGTNFIFGEISFITQSVAAVLQLAVTMDYSVFLMDRYAEEKPKYRTREAAMAKAITGTFASLTGSSLTTVFGFLALCFMRLTLGLDIGLVMAKGVLFGILTVVIVLPAILLLSEKLIHKTRHKSLIPPFNGLNKVTIKLRKFIAIIFVIILVPAYYGQANVQKYYNIMDAMPESMDSIAAMNVLKEDFNMASQHFVITKNTLSDTQNLAMTEKLQNVEGISGVISMQAMLGTSISAEILPSSVTSMLRSDEHQLLMITSVYAPATDECNAQIDEINSIIKSYDSEAMLTGEGPMYKDLINVTDEDFITTSIISMAAIFVLIAIIFKSISVPFILVLSIELAIWINIAISYFSGEVICFITPTIISCVQLGATVDYAILLTTRFREEVRKGKDKKEAMRIAANQSHRSIFQSALIFFVATLGVGIVCDIDLIKSMCTTLARGSLISGLVIMLFLTPVLVVCEGFINKTSAGWRKMPKAPKAEDSDNERNQAEIARICATATTERPAHSIQPEPEKKTETAAKPEATVNPDTTEIKVATKVAKTDKPNTEINHPIKAPRTIKIAKTSASGSANNPADNSSTEDKS